LDDLRPGPSVKAQAAAHQASQVNLDLTTDQQSIAARTMFP